MASVINAVSGSGITQTADGSGVLKIQSNSVTTNALAWVNFNGVTTATIRASYNVSSVTRNGAGDYTVNFTNALSDANYAISVNGYQTTTGGVLIGYAQGSTYTTSATRITTVNSAFTNTDMQNVSISVFGN